LNLCEGLPRLCRRKFSVPQRTLLACSPQSSWWPRKDSETFDSIRCCALDVSFNFRAIEKFDTTHRAAVHGYHFVCFAGLHCGSRPAFSVLPFSWIAMPSFPRQSGFYSFCRHFDPHPPGYARLPFPRSNTRILQESSVNFDL